ncbi:MAG TPA: cysteine desulfurase family protein [Vicinamibacterales bacterium]|nr:cysteine desulfurase family protein [Vicinamibacterales bacterium]
MGRAPVYLDCHATTPVDRRVLEAMLPYFCETFGNPASSTHQWGWQAQTAVEQARKQVAETIGATAREIVFTSGATESNNLALRGVADRTPDDRRHLAVSAIEHKSILEVAHWLESRGWRVTRLPVDRGGRVDPASVEEALMAGASIVSVMAANNEIGVIQPLRQIGALTRQHGALLHVDAAQAVGKIPIDVEDISVDLLSLTAHKIYGPKGCGALFIRKRVEIEPLLLGGGHERGLRAGTLNVPGIVGLGAACAIARAEMATESARVAQLRDRLLDGLRVNLPGVTVNGSMQHRLPNNLHVSFDGVDGEALLVGISDIAVSTGSACSSATGLPSYVLAAIMGRDPIPSAYVRFGLGRFTTQDDVEYAVDRFSAVVRHLRDMAPV